MPTGARPSATYWQDWTNLVIGVWLFVSPWLLAYAGMPTPSWNAWIFGVVIAGISVAALVRYTRWLEWVNTAAGIWMVISPWALLYAGQGDNRATLNAVIVGLLVGVLALWNALAGHADRVAWE